MCTESERREDGSVATAMPIKRYEETRGLPRYKTAVWLAAKRRVVAHPSTDQMQLGWGWRNLQRRARDVTEWWHRCRRTLG